MSNYNCQYCQNLCEPSDKLDFTCLNCQVTYRFGSVSMDLLQTELYTKINNKSYILAKYKNGYSMIFQTYLHLNPELSQPHIEYKFITKINNMLDSITPKNISDKIKTLITFS